MYMINSGADTYENILKNAQPVNRQDAPSLSVQCSRTAGVVAVAVRGTGMAFTLVTACTPAERVTWRALRERESERSPTLAPPEPPAKPVQFLGASFARLCRHSRQSRRGLAARAPGDPYASLAWKSGPAGSSWSGLAGGGSGCVPRHRRRMHALRILVSGASR